MTTALNSNDPPVRILVVDDHPHTADTFARVLRRLGPGVEILLAESGELALEMVKDTAVDLLITDMTMPGMTGLELIKRMQSHPAGRPAYTALITANDVPGLRETAQRLRVNDVIHKPIQPERLCQIVAKAIEGLGHAPRPLAPAEKSQLKILVADDIEDNVALLTRYLESEGYTCLSAKDGVEALTKTRAEMPDLVLLDVSMPVKDGFEALQEMRSDATISHIPVIILTAARIEPMDMQYALSIGADDYVTKPFDRRELLARIRTRLRVKEAEDVIRRQNKELNLLPEIGRELSARLDVDELIDMVLHRTVETLGAFCGHILLMTPKGPLHKSYFFTTPATTTPEIPLPVWMELLDHVNETRQGFIIEDTHKDLHWQVTEGDVTRAAVVVPMFGRNSILGLFALVHEQPGYFKLDHKLLLQAIASQAAIAVENAQWLTEAASDQERMMTVLQNAKDAILWLGAGSQLCSLNTAAEKLFGDDRVKIGHILPEGPGFADLVALLGQARSAQGPIAGEVTWSDGRVFTAFITSVEGGECLILLHDISRPTALDHHKNDLLAVTSHNLKQPLTFISLASQMLPKAGPLNDKQMEFVTRISTTVKKIDQLVENLLELARMEEPDGKLKLEDVDANTVVSEVADEFQLQAETRQLTIQVEKATQPLVIRGDPFQLRHALRNLTDNAIKYTPAGGAICLSVESHGPEVLIRIQDTGYGIPPDDLPYIFDRFYRVRSPEIVQTPGSGLGLAIVKSIMERHSGHVEVESEYGKGSCFKVYLPMTEIPSKIKGKSAPLEK